MSSTREIILSWSTATTATIIIVLASILGTSSSLRSLHVTHGNRGFDVPNRSSWSGWLPFERPAVSSLSAILDAYLKAHETRSTTHYLLLQSCLSKTRCLVSSPVGAEGDANFGEVAMTEESAPDRTNDVGGLAASRESNDTGVGQSHDRNVRTLVDLIELLHKSEDPLWDLLLFEVGWRLTDLRSYCWWFLP